LLRAKYKNKFPAKYGKPKLYVNDVVCTVIKYILGLSKLFTLNKFVCDFFITNCFKHIELETNFAWGIVIVVIKKVVYLMKYL